MTDNRTNEQILRDVAWTHPDSGREALAKMQIEALRAAGRLAGEPTEAQVEAAAVALMREIIRLRTAWGTKSGAVAAAPWIDENALANAALVAAAGAAPMDSPEYRNQVREVLCPACQSRPGAPCTHPTDTGRREVPWVHLSRKDAYSNPSE